MSYLNVPRLYVGGSFYTDPSTVDNDPVHYIPGGPPPSPWQTPQGQHHFQLRNCVISGAVDATGAVVSSDPVIGVAFTSTDLYSTPPVPGPPGPFASPAKMVDLDVYQQAVSAIYGLQVTLTVGSVTLTGDVYPPPVLNSTWFGRVLPTRAWNDPGGTLGYGDDSNAVGTFQSQIRFPVASWPASVSPVVDAVRKATYADADYVYLSFKFVLDAYINVFSGLPENNYLQGRLVGTIGPVASSTEPVQTQGARWLQARTAPDGSTPDPWYYPKFYGAPFYVDEARSTLVIDLAGGLTMQSVGGAPVDLGTLTASVEPLGSPSVALGVIPYGGFTYTASSGIAELALTSEQLAALQAGPLVLRTSRTDIGDTAVLSENQNGIWWAADIRTFMMPSDPELLAPVHTNVYVTQWGKPLANAVLTVAVVSVHGNTPGATVAPTNPGDTPQADGMLSATVTETDSNGIATVTLTLNGDPGERTPWLDSQLYFVNLYYGEPWAGQVQEQQLSVLAWASYPVIVNPEWSDIQTIMERYDVLFPAMKEKISLTDQHSFSVFAWNPPFFTYGYPKTFTVGPGLTAGAIPLFMSMPDDDPRKMPLTRDLSPNKIATVLNWIKNNPPSPAPAAEGDSK